MPLPFKVRPYLPDNKKLALVRLKHLKRKLDRDPKFKDDYVRFMEGVFKDGDAERADKRPETHGIHGTFHTKGSTIPENQIKSGSFLTALPSMKALP